MAGLLEEIALESRVADSGPVPCPKCGCPIQWKPFLVESIPWRCADCSPPAPGLRVPHQRWLENLPGQPTRWCSPNEAVEPQHPGLPPVDPWVSRWLDLVESRRDREGRFESGEATCRCGRGPDAEVKYPSHLGQRVDCKCGRFLRFEDAT